ncbi:hypothetical protein AKJ09_09185 [Labilithrix luteola]|uniref:Uncharacterized protein n=1 Tax=Labilithrix luteola TaxID=1391654 RepID=A0A0K1QA24_9BACT|nr:hypothetical protein [Labilithrix luteola]AKV02522.1 hypothetical protein AKJ09_09185 [Labilithrix luteola]
MRHCRLAVLAAAVATWLALSATARGDTAPGVWDRARDPQLEDTYRLHVEIQRRLTLSGDPGRSQLLLARAMLERANAETSPDVRLRFDLGNVYLRLGDVGKEYYQRSAKVLKAALRDAPDHPMAEESWLWLAFACGHTGEYACERDAYIQVLRRASEEVLRATPLLNLAETSMHLGDLAGAVEGYREALRISSSIPSDTTAPLAVWGLAVALDRSGDRIEAEKQARFAISLERSLGLRAPWGGSVSALLHSENVFFVPEYEVHWYDALGAAALARAATSASEAAHLWRVAEEAFRAYVARATPTGDRWLELAKARHATAKAEREKAERARGKERPKSLGDGDEVTL